MLLQAGPTQPVKTACPGIEGSSVGLGPRDQRCWREEGPIFGHIEIAFDSRNHCKGKHHTGREGASRHSMTEGGIAVWRRGREDMEKDTDSEMPKRGRQLTEMGEWS